MGFRLWWNDTKGLLTLPFLYWSDGDLNHQANAGIVPSSADTELTGVMNLSLPLDWHLMGATWVV